MLGCNKGFSGKGSKRSVELRGKKEAENGLNKQLRAIVRKKKTLCNNTQKSVTTRKL